MDQVVGGSESKVCKQVIASLVPYMYASLAVINFLVSSCNAGHYDLFMPPNCLV